MSDKVIAYKPFLFKVINTTEEKSEEYDQILNLDSYHKIERNQTYVYAVIYFGKELRRSVVAECNNEDGAKYVIDCIMRRQTTTEESVLSVEEKGYDDTQAYF